MPWMLLWTLLWPTLASILLGAAAWSVNRRGARPVLVGRVPTAAMAGVAVLVMAVHPLLGAAPLWIDAPSALWRSLIDWRFALPLVLGLLVLIPFAVVRPRSSTPTGARLAPRTWRSFLSTRWLGALLGVLALIVGLTFAAGMASQPNDAGEYAMYIVDVGPGAIGATIYGWHYSLVPSVLWVLLCAATWWTLSRIARPPLATAQAADVTERRLRSTNAVRVALGALLLHLESILHSLANTSRVSGSFVSGERLPFSASTPFSALTGPLDVLAQVAGILGLALWVFTLLTAVPAPSASRVSVPS
ncbi:hypothetical protein CFK38_10805 [Brachybacterium vulturis]|uniref:Uncharacterized protein n=1 Tax=Brachybacterium vulturis TaxID=2017484 RepID=A0A291GNZ0_9MICO|nr:hypothetical protein [Brachybacterium vulturis]ATG51951.1 hypothetical protein CFK38_10805 [Brachybacterium vulturis]